MRELISHPDVPLHDHLRDVGGRAASILLHLKSHLKLQIPAEELAKAAFIAGICHDFGKAKEQFQDYIYNGKAENKEHAAISSVFTFVVASEVFDRERQPTRLLPFVCRLLPFVCAYAVNRHHGLLCNLEEAFEEAVIEHQIAVSKGKIDDRLWGFQFHYGEPLNLTIEFSDYRDSFEKVKADQIVKQFRCFSDLLGQKAEAQDASENWPLDLYLALLLIISTLTEADVACVISAPEPGPAKVLDPEIIYRYACDQPSVKGKLQELRQDAWKELVEEELEFAEDSACRLTLPTGLGKTLMGLYLAGKLQKPDHTNPVIYALPYLSIIEQATDVARSVFSESSVSVIQHHSLSFPASGQEEAPNFEQARFILEDWQADLVITTFDQLLYSFLTRDRGFIRRFFRLPGAVLLLDEVQTIPYRLIPAIETFLNKLNEKLGTRIIYMTATHPPFLKTSHPMIQNESEYFSSLNRTRLRLQLTPISFSKYLSELGKWLLDRKGKKILLVANTIRSARDLFQHLKKLKENRDFKDMRLFHLSGSVVPVERLRRIREIRRIIGNKDSQTWVVVVSTQCIEAGVDLDMDEAVRDFAPWDSLLQICGRENRFGKKTCSDVWIYRWFDNTNEQSREFHSYIYDSIFADTTLEVLENRDVIEESCYWNIQQCYVRRLQERLSREPSQEVLRTVLSWRFDKLDFQGLFRGQEMAWKISVFCVADDTAERLKEIATELWSSKNVDRAEKLLIELCDSKCFEPLKEFLKVDPSEVKGYVERICSLSKKSKKFYIGKILQPMLQAYTVSLPIGGLEELSVTYITEGFPYIERCDYESLNVGEVRGG